MKIFRVGYFYVGCLTLNEEHVCTQHGLTERGVFGELGVFRDGFLMSCAQRCQIEFLRQLHIQCALARHRTGDTTGIVINAAH